MSSRPLSYTLEARDPMTQARAGTITTPHGRIKTPVFMPVGTQGAVRNLTPDQVRATGAQIILANTYHMSIRPGEDLVRKAGGLHRFMGYDLPILTDSGGFQVFSLPKQITPDGVRFQYEVNGKEVFLSPERSMEIQQALGADIAMVFDECPPYPCSYEYAAESLERTIIWERRSREAHTRPDQALFGIVQGSVFPDLRKKSARALIDIGFDGYAVGGLSVGEGLDLMKRVLDYTTPELPEDKPRYLMGVGLPEDLLEGVERGIDMFDCVIPTRHARGGILYTFQGRMRIQHSRYRRDMYPIDTRCTCYTCQHFSRAYLRHLFSIREVLANTLASIHNIHFYQELMARMRQAILEGKFSEFKRSFLEQYKPDEYGAVDDLEEDESGDEESGARKKKRKVVPREPIEQEADELPGSYDPLEDSYRAGGAAGRAGRQSGMSGGRPTSKHRSSTIGHPAPGSKHRAPRPPSPDQGSSQKGPSERGASQKGPSERGASQKSASERGAGQKGSSERGASQKGLSGRGASQRGTSERGASQKGGADPGSSQGRPGGFTGKRPGPPSSSQPTGGRKPPRKR